MKGTSIILLGVGGSVGFVAGNIFLATKVVQSEKMRAALSDIIADKVSTIIIGESKPKRPIKVSYRDYYNKQSRNRSNNNKYKAEELIFASRADAEEVLSKMKDIVQEYGIVSISDYYEMAGFTSTDYIDACFQWDDLENVSIERVREGYIIKLPLASRHN